MEASAGLAGAAQLVGSITVGARVFAPPNVYVPPKFCGEMLETLSVRRRAPNLQKCCRCEIDVLFCNSKLFWVENACPVCAPPPLKAPSTNNAGSSLLGIV